MNPEQFSRSSHSTAAACAAGAGMDNDPAAAIHIWLVFYRAMTNPALLERMRALLSPAERAREQGYYFEDDRLRYLVTRALTRTTLSRYAPVDPVAWTFRDNPFGRPEIADPDPGAATLDFNISHTSGLIALAVARGRALGIDIENLAAQRASPGIVDHFFAPAEIADMAALAPALRHERFFEYWTFKEAYLKARGMGLSLPLNAFSMHFPDQRTVHLETGAELADDPQRWRLWQLRPSPEYLLALCAERGDANSPAIQVHTVVPAMHGTLFQPAR
jgi:4'-phosphopantetheinyl transferase